MTKLTVQEFIKFVVEYGIVRGDLPSNFKLSNNAQKALERSIESGWLHPDVDSNSIHAMCVYYILGYKDAMEYTGVNY